MSQTNNPTRQKILAASLALFAAGGFEGTSVNAITRAAQVNKATIYYHFESKQAILDCLIEDFLQGLVHTTLSLVKAGDVGAMYRYAAQDARFLPLDADSLGRIYKFMDDYLDRLFLFFEEHRDILRILFAESLKDGNGQELLFRLSDIVASSPQAYRDAFEQMGIPKLDAKMAVIKFFGGILPLAYYSICREAWQARYGMSGDELKAGMRELFRIEVGGYMGAEVRP